MLVASAVTARVAFNAQSDAQDIREALGSADDPIAAITEHNAFLDRRDSYRTAAYVLVGAGAAAGIAAALLYYFDNPSAESAERRGVKVLPVSTGDYAGVSLFGGW